MSDEKRKCKPMKRGNRKSHTSVFRKGEGKNLQFLACSGSKYRKHLDLEGGKEGGNSWGESSLCLCYLGEGSWPNVGRESREKRVKFWGKGSGLPDFSLS